MFNLVADIERYPEFVPGCRDLRVINRSCDSLEIITAEMVIGYHMITERFTCTVVLDRPRLKIDVNFIKGPFKKLTNTWRFHFVNEHSCDVEFDIEFELSSQRLSFIIQSLFDRMFVNFVDAFEARADELTRNPSKLHRKLT